VVKTSGLLSAGSPVGAAFSLLFVETCATTVTKIMNMSDPTITPATAAVLVSDDGGPVGGGNGSGGVCGGGDGGGV